MTDFAGVAGSAVFRAFADGELTYVRLALERAEEQSAV